MAKLNTNLILIQECNGSRTDYYRLKAGLHICSDRRACKWIRYVWSQVIKEMHIMSCVLNCHASLRHWWLYWSDESTRYRLLIATYEVCRFSWQHPRSSKELYQSEEGGLLLWSATSPDRTFRNFQASKSVDRLTDFMKSRNDFEARKL